RRWARPSPDPALQSVLRWKCLPRDSVGQALLGKRSRRPAGMRGIALDIRSAGQTRGDGVGPMGQRSVEVGRSLSERIVASVDEALVVLDCQGRILLVNPAARALLGVGEADRDAGDLPVEVSDLASPGAAGKDTTGP